MRAIVAVPILAGLLGVGAVSALALAADASEALVFPGTAKVSVVLTDDAKPTLVALTNHGTRREDVTFSVAPKDAATPAANPVTVTADKTTIEAESTSWFALTFVPADPSKAVDGFLVANAAGAASATVEIAIGPDPGGYSAGPGGVIGIAALIALLLVVIRYFTKLYDLRTPMGNAKWKFDESWASTFTAVGAVFGTVLGAGLLPDTPNLLGKAQFAGLNVFFGTVVVLSAFLFSAIRGKDGKGLPVIYFLAAFLTFAAVIGELMTLGLLVLDSTAKVESTALSYAFGTVVVLAILLILKYGWTVIDEGYTAATKSAITGKPRRGIVPPDMQLARVAAATRGAAPADIDPTETFDWVLH
jgi:hypothetical protein